MTRFHRLTALLLSLALLFTLSSLTALAEDAAAPEESPAVSEEAPEESPPDEYAPMSEESAAPATAGEESPAPGPSASPAPAATMPILPRDQMPKPSADKKAEAVVTEPGGVALFEVPAIESAVLSQLQEGSVLELVALGNPWSKVKYGAQTGYAPTYALSFGYGSPQPAIALVTAPGGKLTLRAEMATRSKALAGIRSGRAVLLLARGETFSLIRHESKEGYVLTQFIREVAVGRDMGLLTEVVSIVPAREANVRVRAEPSRKGAVYTTVKSGQSVVVLNIKDDWAQIEYEGYHGYMMAEYLKRFD
jgi:uncharacterized protein YgiM (DUF1202 family)